MALPASITICEDGPREGFQFEGEGIATADKIRLIDALSLTGLKVIQVASFVHPKLVPGMADAEDVVNGIQLVPGVRYTGLWLNERGFLRAKDVGRLSLRGTLSFVASEPFCARNVKRTLAENFAEQRRIAEVYLENGIPLERASIQAAFGCNFQGQVETGAVVAIVDQIRDLVTELSLEMPIISLADTMAWATPLAIKRTIDAIKQKYPEQRLSLHLHDTRGMAIANAVAGMESGVDLFDASVGGLGGCPFAGHRGAAGNICTEDLVFLCEEMGVETGIDLDTLIESAKLAEDIVGRPLPGSVKSGGSLARFRQVRGEAK